MKKQGFVTQKALLLAGIMVIGAFFFPLLKVEVSCVQTKSMSIFDLIRGGEGETPEGTPENCKGNLSQEESTTETGTLTGTESAENTEGYVPMSYYDSTGISLTCENAHSYYAFSIPSEAPPQATGIETLSISNNKGWDMWMRITKIETANGLTVNSYTSMFKPLANNSRVSFPISWTWDVPGDYGGGHGSAIVYFETKCTKPSDDTLYAGRPVTPEGFTIDEVTDSSVALSWNKMTDAKTYRLYRNSTLIYEGTGTAFKDTGLWSGTWVGYYLYALNEHGNSEPFSHVWTYTKGVSPLPTAPTNFKVSNITDTTAMLSWKPVSNADTYILKVRNTVVYEGSATSFTVTGLNPGEHYNYWVAAKNSEGTSDQAYTGAYMNGEAPFPSPTQNFIIDAWTETTMTLKWDATPKATSYDITQNGTLIYSGNDTSLLVKHLIPGTYYYYTIRPKNSYGSAASTTSAAKYTNGTSPYPEPPTNVSLDAITNNTATLTWNPVSNANRYVVTLNDGTVAYDGNKTSAFVTGLKINTSYIFYVRAINENGESNNAQVSGKTTNKTYDNNTDINSTCETGTFTKTFTFPEAVTPGASGKFDILVTNNSAEELNVRIDSIQKSGALFEGNTPITLTYDSATKTIASKGNTTIPIQWDYPADGNRAYEGRAGELKVTIATPCN